MDNDFLISSIDFIKELFSSALLLLLLSRLVGVVVGVITGDDMTFLDLSEEDDVDVVAAPLLSF